MPNIFISPKPKVEKTKQITSPVNKILTENTGNILASFVQKPTNITFITQGENETLVLLLRKHFITNINWILTAMLMILAPLLLSFFPPIFDFLPDRFKFMAIIIWYLVTLAFVFESFLSWFFNVYLVTSERVVEVNFLSLTYREINDAPLEKIQDTSLKTGGLFQSIFDYGDVYVQTAGAIPRIDLIAVPKPAQVVEVINELMEAEEHHQ